MTTFVMIHDLINSETGNTYREDNLQIPHNIPIGTLVEAKWDAWFGDGACWKVHARLWVVGHNRDCDGTPLYTISRWRDPAFVRKFGADTHSGFSESALTPVELTEDVISGRDCLELEDA